MTFLNLQAEFWVVPSLFWGRKSSIYISKVNSTPNLGLELMTSKSRVKCSRTESARHPFLVRWVREGKEEIFKERMPTLFTNDLGPILSQKS